MVFIVWSRETVDDSPILGVVKTKEDISHLLETKGYEMVDHSFPVEWNTHYLKQDEIEKVFVTFEDTDDQSLIFLLEHHGGDNTLHLCENIESAINIAEITWGIE